MSNTKQSLIYELNKQVRLVSANSVLFSQAVAERAGTNATDNECLDFLLLHGPQTAGKLAQLTGLTTGAVTAMIDRLEKADYVKRESNKQDRRKVLVVPNFKKINNDIGKYTESMGKAFMQLANQFNESELTTLLIFLQKANLMTTEEIYKLKK